MRAVFAVFAVFAMRGRWFSPLVLAMLLTGTAPGFAAGWIDAGGGGRWVVVRQGNELIVFGEPGQIAARQTFDQPLIAFAASPATPVVHALVAGEPTTEPTGDAPGPSQPPQLVRWDWMLGTVGQTALAGRAAPQALAFAAGGHAVFVGWADSGSPDNAAVWVVGEATLDRRRTLAADLTAEDGPLLDLASSVHDWFVAAATPSAVFIGPSEAPSLSRVPLALAGPGQPVTVRFVPGGQAAVAGGATALAVVPSRGGAPRRLSLSGAQPSPAFDLSSDSAFAFLASGGRLLAVRLKDGLVHLAGDVRPEPATPLAAVTCRAWGLVAILYDDATVAWYRPLARQLTATWPAGLGATWQAGLRPAPMPGLPRPTLPPTNERFDAAARLLATPELFVQDGEPLDLYVLDAGLEPMRDLEAVAREQGWAALAIGWIATQAGRDDAVVPALAGLTDRLRAIDRVEFRNVRPAPGVSPDLLETALGPREDTGTQRTVIGGASWPIVRFGPLLLPLENGAFPAQATIMLTVESVGAWAGR